MLHLLLLLTHSHTVLRSCPFPGFLEIEHCAMTKEAVNRVRRSLLARYHPTRSDRQMAVTSAQSSPSVLNSCSLRTRFRRLTVVKITFKRVQTEPMSEHDRRQTSPDTFRTYVEEEVFVRISEQEWSNSQALSLSIIEKVQRSVTTTTMTAAAGHTS